ncbi:MAG: efflux RND transporter periplasmic adaptor subunit [Pirellulaceae bacterium]
MMFVIKRLLKPVLVLMAFIAGIYWWRFAPVAVEEHAVVAARMTAEVLGTGTLEARVAATLSPKIAGRIAELMADQGDQVAKGELLVRLDGEELRQQLAIAQANVEAATAAIERLNADKERAQAVFQQTQKTYERAASLQQQNAISREEVDKASEGLAVAQSGVARAEAAIVEGRMQLMAAQKTAQYHEARMMDTEIRAAFDGLIVRRNREPGDVAVPGSSVLTLISTDELWVSAWVDETEMSKLHSGQEARVVFRSEPERTFAGRVARLGREADRETREFIVDIHVLELPTNWAVGQRADAFIQVADVEVAVQLPAKFIERRDGVEGVFLLSSELAVWRPIQIGLRQRDVVQVLDGLTANDVVIRPINSSTPLRPNQRVARP